MITAPTRLSFIAAAAVVVVLAVVIELIRRRRLQERYALLWLATGAVLLVLALWREALHAVARAAGIEYAPSALYMVAGLFVLALLLHYSTVLTRLADQNRALAQRLALLEAELREAGGERARRPRRLAVAQREQDRPA